MIVTHQKIGFLYYYNKIFADNIVKKDVFNIVQYSDFRGKSVRTGFLKSYRHTLVIDLRLDIESLFSNMKACCRNYIRRANKLDMEVERSFDIPEFVNFYNLFARKRRLPLLSVKKMKIYSKYLVITKVLYKGVVLVMHSYIVDNDGVVILHSASNQCRDIDSKIIGMGNRLLHFEDILFFKRLGIYSYDFGGISFEDEKKRNISRFKCGFGGEIKSVVCYKSVLYCLLEGMKKIMNTKMHD